MDLSGGWPFFLALAILFVGFPWTFTTFLTRFRNQMSCTLDMPWLMWMVHVVMGLMAGGGLYIVLELSDTSLDDPLVVTAQVLWILSLCIFVIGLHLSLGQCYWATSMLLLFCALVLYLATTIVHAVILLDSLLGNIPFFLYILFYFITCVRLYRNFYGNIPRMSLLKTGGGTTPANNPNQGKSIMQKGMEPFMSYVPKEKAEYISMLQVSSSPTYKPEPEYEN